MKLMEWPKLLEVSMNRGNLCNSEPCQKGPFVPLNVVHNPAALEDPRIEIDTILPALVPGINSHHRCEHLA